MSALDDCLHWVRERELVRARHDANLLPPWTDDPIIAKYRFCNVRREDDSVTVWIRENIRESFAEHPYLWFMLCIARQINWPDTLRHMILAYPGAWPSHSNFSPGGMENALTSYAKFGNKVFTGAYNITAPPVKGMTKSNWVANHTLGNLWHKRATMFKPLWDNGKQPSMKYVHATLMHFDCWGPFMAYQAVVDMRFTRLLRDAKDVSYWAAAGPGTIRGLNRIAGRRLDAPLKQDQALAEMVRLAPIIRKETGVEFDFSDVPNIMCETDKYIRVKNGEGAPRALYVPGRGS